MKYLISLYFDENTNKKISEHMETVAEVTGNGVSNIDDVKISKFYRPFQWLPHITIGKKMTAEEQTRGFGAVQSSFQIIKGKAVRVGLATAGPYDEFYTCFLS